MSFGLRDNLKKLTFIKAIVKNTPLSINSNCNIKELYKKFLFFAPV